MRVALADLAALVLLSSLGCTAPRLPYQPPPPRHLTDHAHALAADCVALGDATAIRCGERIAAALLCFAPEGRTCRALAVRYDDGELTWLYRPPAFDPSHPEFFRPPDEKDTLRAFGPSVAWDGRLIWFGARTVKDRGVVHEYDVQSGELRAVERSSEWKVWAAEPQHRALPIVVAAEPIRDAATPAVTPPVR